MAAYPSQDSRPLKKARLGPPDVYPQDAKQKEVSPYIFFLSYVINLSLFFHSATEYEVIFCNVSDLIR